VKGGRIGAYQTSDLGEDFRYQTYDLGRFVQGLDEEILERLHHHPWFVSILFGFSFEYTWPISFKLVYSFMCLSIVPSIFVDEFVLHNPR
jgi:hypothetical protein